MAVVGTAFVRLRVIGDKLKKDIGDSVQNAVDTNSSALGQAGETVGEKISEGAGKEVERSLGSQMGRISDDIGDAIGRRMAENMGRSLRSRLAKPFKDGFASVRPIISRAGDQLSESFSSFTNGIKKKFGGKGGKGGLGGILMAGMGVLVTVLPSILAGAGAVVGAYAATAVTAIAAIGPAAAGAGIAAVAAFSAIKISAGLIGLAMKAQTPALADFQERAQAFRDSIGKPIQGGLLSGLNASMRLLNPVVSAMQPHLEALGTIVGDVAIGFADAVRQGVMMDRIGRILSTNNEFVRQAGGGVSALGQAFIVLLDHLSPVTTAIGEMVGQFGTWALGAINAASASGQLDAWITRMWSSFLRLSGIVVDFGIGIYNVFSAAQPAAGNLTTSLENIARKFREWTGDEANQTRMTVFFEKMRVIVAQVNDILGDLASSGLKALEGTDVSSLGKGLETLRSLGPPIAQMFRSIQEAAGPQLLDAFQSFADIITQLAESGVLGMLTGAFANLLSIISGVLALPGVSTILGFIGALAVMGKTVGLLVSVLGFLWRTVKPIITIIRVLALVFTGPVVAIAALVAALIWFFTQTELGRDIIAAVWDFIKNAISAAVDWIIGAWDWMVAAFQTAVAWVVDLAQQIWSAISTAFNAVVDTVTTVFTTIWNVISSVLTTVWTFISGVFTAIWNVISTILTTIWTVISTIFNAYVTVITTVLSFIWGVISRVFQAIYAVIYTIIMVIYAVIMAIWNAISGYIFGALNAIWTFIQWIWNGILTTITTTLSYIWGVISAVFTAVWGFISNIFTTIWGAISGAWESISSTINTALDAIWEKISSVFNTVWGFISGILTSIGSFFSEVWNTISSTVSGVVSGIWETITEKFNSIVTYIKGIPGKILEAGADFLNAGKTLIQKIVDGIASAASFVGDVGKNIVNSVVDFVNTNIIDRINSTLEFSIAGVTIDPPDISRIPRLAKGGVVNPTRGGTVALIGEAGRSERVEPLDPQGLSKRDRALIELLAGGAGGAPNVQVFLGTREIEDIIDVVVEDREDSLAGRVLVGTKGS